jgi:HD-GYP domain-containing protein (c-di-GMP phosphodiesterase class II)
MSVNSNEQPNLLEVPVHNLQAGMYVAGLDRPWLETPFAVQGFYVLNQEDIDFVAQHCAYVMVDPRRRTKSKAVPTKERARRTYKDQSSLKSELKSAEIDLTSAAESMSKVFAQLRTGGHLDLKIVQAAINPLIESVLRNNEAMAALVRMKKKGEYLYNHSLSVAVWATILGRHLGLARKQLERLALGSALLDVGMASVDDQLTQFTGKLSEREFASIRQHVALGVDLLKLKSELPDEVIQTVAFHHERHDGSGYPNGLSGKQIPMFARIAGLVDSYDAMITPRPYAQCRTSFEAVQELADQKEHLFQGALVEQFLQAIGLFPTGSVVQLNSGEIGVIVAQNAARRLRPKIVVVIDAEGRRNSSLVVMDLSKYSPGEGALDLWIKRELEPGAHGIQPDEFFL